MNYLVLLPDECDGCKRAVISGARLKEVQKTHGLRVGGDVAVAILGGMLGSANVAHVSDAEVILALDLTREPPPRLDVELIVAVPRPQTVKKVLQVATSSGVRAVHFVKTDNVVKSYLSSKGLLDHNLKKEMLKALEQVGDSVTPKVEVHQNFSRYLASRFSPAAIERLNRVELLYADTRAGEDATLAGLREKLSPETAVVLALGPESGWSAAERALLKSYGFRAVSLGPRIQRVEIALALLIGQIGLLNAMGRYDGSANYSNAA